MDGSEQSDRLTHARVLITNAYGPYDVKWNQSPSDLLGARLARGHVMLERAAELPTWSLYLLAENISNPTTVLEYPRWEDFTDAVREGYDYIAIETKTIHVPRIARMVKEIHALSPKTKIILGGYGVSTLHEGVPCDPDKHRDYLLANVDHFCRSEGVRFLRELLGDAPFDRPITQYTLPPAPIVPYDDKKLHLTDMPAMLIALGCPSACDFCNTSAFFHHKKVAILSPAEVYAHMKHHQKKLGRDEITFILFDEDMFLDSAYVRELGRLIRSDKKSWGFRWISFGSMRALQQYTPEELRECGVEGIWIGVESGLTDAGENKATYVKRTTEVSPPQLFQSLREVGILTIGSTILGFEFHTPQNIAQDIEYFVNLRPTFYQIGPMRPCPGTKLYKLMQKNEKIKPNYSWEDFHLWETGTHHFDHFTGEEVQRWFEHAHERMKTVNGSPVLQIYETHVLAYERFRNSTNAFLRYQSTLDRKAVEGLLPVIRGLEWTAPSKQAAKRAHNLVAAGRSALGDSTPVKKAYQRALGELMGFGLWYMDRKHKSTPKQWAPDMRRTRYPYREAAAWVGVTGVAGVAPAAGAAVEGVAAA
ncbi:MAG TPA: hypothetical protein VF331_21425 [Polyangiales bacterium]